MAGWSTSTTGNGLSTRYGHLSSIDVRVGQSIRTGQIIGKIWLDRTSTGPHLHYETRVRGEGGGPEQILARGTKARRQPLSMIRAVADFSDRIMQTEQYRDRSRDSI